MNLKYRKIIAKIRPLHKMARMVMYNSGFVFYKRKYRKENYAEFFKEIKDSKLGKRCFIVGNGPSLNVEDLNRLMNEDCFGTNEIHKLFCETKWRPKYYVIIDRYSKSTPEEIKKMDSEIVFLGDYYWRFNKVYRDDAICLHQKFYFNDNYYRFSKDISKYIVNSPTVTYAAMQIAAYMGYTEIILIGFDHNYTFEFAKDKSVVKTDTISSHFFKDEIPEDIIADVAGMTKAYESFREYANSHNIVVKNATRGGKLETFDRVEFDTLFE